MSTQELTSGPIRHHVLRMGAPMFIGMLVNNLYGLADLYWVSHLGDSAVAAVSIVYNLTIAVMALGQVLSVGAVALIAQAAGRRDPAEVRRLFHQSLVLSLLVGLLFALPLLLFRQPYAERFAGDPQTAAITAEVMLWFAPALGLMIPMLVLAAALRGVGDVRTAVSVQMGSVLMNMAFAPLIVFGIGPLPALGAPGAAAATFFSTVFALGILFWRVLAAKRFLGLAGSEWRPALGDWKRMLAIGLPAGSEFALMALFFGYVMWVLRDFGADAQAAFGIGMRWLQLGLIPAIAVGFAAAAVAGQNYGAGLPARVRQALGSAIIVGLISTAIACLIYELFPHQLIGLFSDNPSVHLVAVDMMHILAWNLLASSLVMTFSGVFSGMGHTVPPLISSIVRYSIVIGISSVLHASGKLSIVTIWWLQLGATLLQVLLNAVFMRRLLRSLSDMKPVVATAVA